MWPIRPRKTAQKSKLPWNHCSPKGTLGIAVTAVQKLVSNPWHGGRVGGDRANDHLPHRHHDSAREPADRSDLDQGRSGDALPRSTVCRQGCW